MRGLMEFLSFQYFISFPVLIAFYYLGSVGIPVVSWYAALRVKRKYWIVSEAGEKGRQFIREHMRPRDRAVFAALFLSLFLSMELMWRVIFEYFIAYLQMRDALLILTR